jgi:hypothetical protein
VPDCARVREDLVVVAALITLCEQDRDATNGPAYLERLVTNEVDLLEVLVLDVPQSVRLVPSMREDVERDLAANGVRETIIWELGLERVDEGRANVVDLYDLRPGRARLKTEARTLS